MHQNIKLKSVDLMKYQVFYCSCSFREMQTQSSTQQSFSEELNTRETNQLHQRGEDQHSDLLRQTCQSTIKAPFMSALSTAEEKMKRHLDAQSLDARDCHAFDHAGLFNVNLLNSSII